MKKVLPSKKFKQKVPKKSVSQNIKNIFFVLKIRKNIFLPGQQQEEGQQEGEEELSLPVLLL